MNRIFGVEKVNSKLKILSSKNAAYLSSEIHKKKCLSLTDLKKGGDSQFDPYVCANYV